MGLKFASPSAAVGLNDLWTIESDALERIHGNENDAGIGIDTMLSIAIANCMQDWSACERNIEEKLSMRVPEGSLR